MASVIVVRGWVMVGTEHVTLPPRAGLASHGVLARKSGVSVTRRVLEEPQIAACRFADASHRSRPLSGVAEDSKRPRNSVLQEERRPGRGHTGAG